MPFAHTTAIFIMITLFLVISACNKEKRQIPETFFVEGYMTRISAKSSACKMGLVKEVDRGLSSRTDFTLVRTDESYVWLDCILETGRTHQIRLHSSSVGLPLVGDGLYGGPEGFEENGGRIMLHSRCLEFTHPVTGKNIRADSPLPALF